MQVRYIARLSLLFFAAMRVHDDVINLDNKLKRAAYVTHLYAHTYSLLLVASTHICIITMYDAASYAGLTYLLPTRLNFYSLKFACWLT